ncbi:MAG: hypothetical protein WC998_05545 [Candidatus Paceibacterota bacterium]|jgi:uncharacterized membrane protein
MKNVSTFETIIAIFCGAWALIFLVYLFIRAFSRAQYAKRQNTEIYDSEIQEKHYSNKK